MHGRQREYQGERDADREPEDDAASELGSLVGAGCGRRPRSRDQHAERDRGERECGDGCFWILHAAMIVATGRAANMRAVKWA